MRLPRWMRAHLPCRGCLGELGHGAEAGLCAHCWEGLCALPEERCAKCALCHDPEKPCPDPVAWEHGDALWDYHGGRPALGAMLVPAIKSGEVGWKRVLLHRLEGAPLPDFCTDIQVVSSAPTAFHRRFLRGFDLAEDAARCIAKRLQRPYAKLLWKSPFVPAQSTQGESARRHLPAKAIRLRPGASVQGKTILLVDDVWTTGTTLLRCARALEGAGAGELKVLSLFRSKAASQ